MRHHKRRFFGGELLERRDLLAVTVGFWDPSTGALKFLSGGSSASDIEISVVNGDIHVVCNSQVGTILQDGSPVTVPANQVQSLTVDYRSYSFDDVIDVSGVAAGVLAASATVTLYGGGGNDTIVGSAYGDVIVGGDGNDVLRGKVGSDVYVFDAIGGSDLDTVDEGPVVGQDVFDFSAMTAAVNVDLKTFADPTANGSQIQVNSHLTIARFQTNIDSTIIEKVIGTSFADTLGGSTWATELHGGSGADVYIPHTGATSVHDSFAGLGVALDKIQYGSGTHTVDVTYQHPSGSVSFTATRTFSVTTEVTLLVETIDAMFAAISSGSYDSQWDFYSDGQLFGAGGNVNAQTSDVRVFIEDIISTYFGDANLDGVVNAEDMNIIATSWLQSVEFWDDGDVNGDGVVDAADLNLLGQNWQQGV